ncbi:hypothetical protein PFISCL1PPCAC_19630, partial [Pristionchus fissidentatus]
LLSSSLSSSSFSPFSTMVFGCLRRCGMNESDDDLVPYEKARLATVTPNPISPPIQAIPIREPLSPHRKATIALDHNDSFVPLLCSTKMAGATGHHRSISLLGGEGSFHDMIITDRCRSFHSVMDRSPPKGRLLRHDHYSTEKFISTSTLVPIDPSKITEDRTREAENSEDRITHPIPLEPTIRVIRGPLPMSLPSSHSDDTDAISTVVDSMVTTVVTDEWMKKMEREDHEAIGGLVEKMVKSLEQINNDEDSDWRETPLLNQTVALSPIVEEKKSWKVYEDEENEEKREGIVSTTPLHCFSSTRGSIKLKVRDLESPLVSQSELVDVCLKTPDLLSQQRNTQLETRAPLRPTHNSSRSEVTITGSRVLFTRD